MLPVVSSIIVAFRNLQKSIREMSIKQKEKTISFPDSLVVTHPTTNKTARGLTSMIERVLVLSSSYGRLRGKVEFIHNIYLEYSLMPQGRVHVWSQMALTTESSYTPTLLHRPIAARLCILVKFVSPWCGYGCVPNFVTFCFIPSCTL